MTIELVWGVLGFKIKTFELVQLYYTHYPQSIITVFCKLIIEKIGVPLYNLLKMTKEQFDTLKIEYKNEITQIEYWLTWTYNKTSNIIANSEIKSKQNKCLLKIFKYTHESDHYAENTFIIGLDVLLLDFESGLYDQHSAINESLLSNLIKTMDKLITPYNKLQFSKLVYKEFEELQGSKLGWHIIQNNCFCCTLLDNTPNNFT